MPTPLRALATAALLLIPIASHAQAQGDAPQFAMGSGRMVRGTITAVTPEKLTLKTEQGDTYFVALTPNTQLRHGRDQLKLADVHPGDGAGAMGEIDQPNKTVHALFVGIVTADDLKKAREAMGKTFISGTVTSLDDTKITILRTDKVTQTIQVDEDTSFRRGGRGLQMMLGENGAAPNPRPNRPENPGQQAGESITLADIKVGDLVAGPGTLKNGTFTPTQLGVTDPAAQRQRRRNNPQTPPAEPK